MRTLIFVFSVVVAAWAKSAAGKLVVLSGATTASSSKTASFQYYGPRHLTISAPALFLPTSEICKPDRTAVRGKIVVVDSGGEAGGEGCTLSGVYVNLQEAGAVGCVFASFWSPPGLLTYIHETRDPTVHVHGNMTFVSAFVGDKDLTEWKSSMSLVL